MSNEEPGLKFVELKAIERSRIYRYADGGNIRIEGVVRICVRPSGSHRLETADGRKWVVLAGWQAIEIDTDAWTF